MKSIKRLSGCLIVFAIYTCCTSNRSKVLIVDYTNNARAGTFLKKTSPGRWQVVTAKGNNSFREDSLKNTSTILISFSVLNQMGHRDITSLKRYFESGGGGVVAIRDSLLNQKGWPWLQSWNEKPAGENIQDNGRMYIVGENFTDEELAKSIHYTVGKNKYPVYSKCITLPVPDSTRYSRILLAQGLEEPLEMAILPNNDVLFVERKGSVKLYNASDKKVKVIANFNVFSGIEDGLLGVAADPQYVRNNWVYFYYAVGETSVNRLSRFELDDDTLIQSTEKILLEIPTQRKYCCHSAGNIAFDADGLLYLSTGDNTNAEETEGYTPVDERPGHELADDQAAAANTNDLRGKILRIKPEPNGTYSIPDGNLFPKNQPKCRPEIYVMGCRNPYRFSIDRKNKFVYWGDVGPDTKVPGEDGTLLSYDEFNQARKPGFFGWPYFLGNNEAFPLYDFATKKERDKKNPFHPVNLSRNNTGISELPPAQPAMIWYGKGWSKHFPLVGKGGASAMAGPVYYSDLFTGAKYKLADYYDGKLIIYEWIRGWIMAVTFDEQGNYLRMEPFLENFGFAAPIDMKFGSDGALYVLEYGTNWFSKNTDAKLVRIEYSEGNRDPVANIQAEKQYGAAPLAVKFTAASSMDYDRGDKLSYTWQLEKKELKGINVQHTFKSPGVYDVVLTVKDGRGGKGTSLTRIYVGNTPPEVHIQTTSNRSFYWDNNLLNYRTDVKDAEDRIIDSARVNLSFGYLPSGKDVEVILAGSGDPGDFKYLKGKQLTTSLDCKSCHSLDKQSVGPKYADIAARYVKKAGAIKQLVNKIIQGGSGNWGTRPMTPHPALSENEGTEMVNYILSLSEKKNKLPLQGSFELKDHIGKGTVGSYLLTASYTDGGANNIESLVDHDHIVLRNPLVQVEDHDEGNVTLGTITTVFLTFATGIRDNSYVKFKQIDLTMIKNLKYKVQSDGAGGNIELRLDKRDGPLVSTVTVTGGKINDLKKGWREISTPVKETKGIYDLYFVFTNPRAVKQNLFNLDWIYFSR